MARMGRPPIYPWDNLFDGGRHDLVHGIDFELEPYVMQRVIGVQSRRRGVLIATRRRGGTIEVGPRDDFGFTLNEPMTEMASVEED